LTGTVITDGALAVETEHFLLEAATIAREHGESLVRVAFASIDHGLAHGKALAVDPLDYPPELGAEGPSFVTLRRKGALLGCIGHVKACRPLVVDVADNAFAAANRDNRFSPVSRDDRRELAVSVTLIGPHTEMAFADEDDLSAQLRVGEDGLIIENGGRRAVFLPQVWSAIPEPKRFLSQLKLKMGLAADEWHAGFRAWRFAAQSISSDAVTTELDR
jgi:AmmeMemoRadiSam system protein A